MLTLNRKVGEVIKIGDDIELKILDINGKQIRLGINAPDHVNIAREEVYKKDHPPDED